MNQTNYKATFNYYMHSTQAVQTDSKHGIGGDELVRLSEASDWLMRCGLHPVEELGGGCAARMRGAGRARVLVLRRAPYVTAAQQHTQTINLNANYLNHIFVIFVLVQSMKMHNVN